MRLNLGCGTRQKMGWVNVDRADMTLANGPEFMRWDLDVSPWPWKDESVDEIEARDVFEHVDSALVFMNECWRILKPSAYLYIHTPHYRSVDAFTDPTHRRFPTEHTFDYWVPGTLLFIDHNVAYGGARFELVTLEPDNGSMNVLLRRLVK